MREDYEAAAAMSLGPPAAGPRVGGDVTGLGTTTGDRILDAAARLFYLHGYHATTMRQIASAVGIKAGSLYSHFSGKQELLFRIACDTMRDMLDRVCRAMAAEDTPEARLRAFVREHTRYCIVERYRACVADEQLRGLEPGNRRRVIEIRDEYERLLRDVIRECGEDGNVTVANVPVTANAIATMASQVSSWYRESGELSPDQVAEIYADIAVGAALRPGPVLTTR